MLISFSKRFIFIAKPKTGSTTLEAMLKRYAEIRLVQTAFGKHMPYGDIEQFLGFMFDQENFPLRPPIDRYFRFGVIREPVEWLLSWYNYLSRQELFESSAARSTRHVSFDSFVDALMNEDEQHMFATVAPQLEIYKDKSGFFSADYLIPCESINKQLPELMNAYGLKVGKNQKAMHLNASRKVVGRSDISAALENKIYSHYADDMLMYEKATSGGFGRLQDVIEKKMEFFR